MRMDKKLIIKLISPLSISLNKIIYLCPQNFSILAENAQRFITKMQFVLKVKMFLSSPAQSVWDCF